MIWRNSWVSTCGGKSECEPPSHSSGGRFFLFQDQAGSGTFPTSALGPDHSGNTGKKGSLEVSALGGYLYLSKRARLQPCTQKSRMDLLRVKLWLGWGLCQYLPHPEPTPSFPTHILLPEPSPVPGYLEPILNAIPWKLNSPSSMYSNFLKNLNSFGEKILY